MLTNVERDSANPVRTCFVFGELPLSSFQDAGGTFRPIGLAYLKPARKRRRRDAGAASGRCLLPEVAHAHVHTVALDLGPMEQPSTQLNWPAELQELAKNPDSAAAVTRFQGKLRDYGDARPSVNTQLVRSRGLVWRNGNRVPVSGTYERIHTTVPLVGLLSTRSEVAAALGRCLADRERHQTSFLLTCVEAADLGEQNAMLASVSQEERPDVIDALYGYVSLNSGQLVVIALPM